MTTAMLEAALTYIAHGFSVIPTHPHTKRPFWPRLPRLTDSSPAGKRRPTWKLYQQKIASPVTVRYWFGDNFPNVALVCGQVSGGLVVFDFDYEADIVLRHWWPAIQPWGRQLTIARSGQGYHVYLRVRELPVACQKVAFNEAGQVLIEIRGEGGLVQAPPSRHPSGRRYRWLHGDPGQIPVLPAEAFHQLVQTAVTYDRRPEPAPHDDASWLAWQKEVHLVVGENMPRPQFRLNRYVEMAVAKECAHLAGIGKGNRNAELNKAAFRLGRFVGAGLVTERQIMDVLAHACQQNHYIPDDGYAAFAATVRSGLTSGAQQGPAFYHWLLSRLQGPVWSGKDGIEAEDR